MDDSRNLNIDAIAKYTANLPAVETVQILGLKPHPDVNILCEQIKSNNLERIVIAGDMPGYFKPVFTKAMAMIGGNMDEIRLASFQEHGARGENAMDRAKAIVACAPWVFFPSLPGIGHSRLEGVAGIHLLCCEVNRYTSLNKTNHRHSGCLTKHFHWLWHNIPKMVSVGQHE
jgi:hypothetical protein